MRKRKLLSLIVALALCFTLLAGCGGGSGTDTGDTGSDAGADGSPATSEPSGKVEEFIVINHDSTTSMCQLYVETLFNAIGEESNGQMKFNYFPGGSLFGATESLDAVANGSADACWSTVAFFGGVFPISEFINLPLTGINSAQMATAVFQTMVEEIPECAAEYDKWHPLAFHGSSVAPLSTVGKKIDSPSDFNGMQIRVAGTIPTMYLNALGATAIAMPTSDVYEALSKNVVDGMANDWHNIDCFKLYEAVDYVMDVPINTSACFVLMNKDRYAGLSDDMKGIFDKYSESGFAGDMAGYWWDSCNFWVADKMDENGVEIYKPNDEVSAFMTDDAIVQQVHQAYIDYLNGLGIDGQAMYEKCMEITNRYVDDFANVFDEPFHYDDWDMSQVDGYQGLAK